ncbi:hypothetical protein JCM11251_004895 [Rhodosporidiobolus azoricus]
MAATENKKKAAPKTMKSDQPPRKKARRVPPPDTSDEEDDAGVDSVEEAEEGSDASSVKEEVKAKKGKKKEPAASKGKGKKAAPGKGKRKKLKVEEEDYSEGSESEEEDDEEDSEGGLNTRVVGQVKKAPKPKGNAETHVILPTTMDFLARVAKNNDREWFKAHDAEYRHAELNFKTFVTAWVPKATEADWSLPHLPAKDLIQRIYRDVRFSKDKTPYKTHFSASTSRTGRKGPFGFYYVQIKPGNKSCLGCGMWSPAANELKLIRNQILRDSKPLRELLSEPEFVKLFGEPKPRMDNRIQSVFGWDNQLKNAPKLEGVDKNHKDIDLLKCRNFAVNHTFPDDVVTADDFLDTLKNAMSVAAPFVQYLNDIVCPPEPDEDQGGEDQGVQSSGGDEDDEAEEGEGEEEDDE